MSNAILAAFHVDASPVMVRPVFPLDSIFCKRTHLFLKGRIGKT